MSTNAARAIPSFPPEPCDGCVHRGRMVGARGNPEAPIVIIGESPSSQDVAQGVPLVGPQGKVLMKGMPLKFDMDKDSFATLAMQCFPPKFQQQVKNEAAKETCTRGCHSRLMEQIWRHPRKLIIAMGKWANASVFNDYDFKVTQRRGELLKVTNPNNPEQWAYVMPINHPAALIRGAGSFKHFKDDIHKALTAIGYIPPEEAKEIHKTPYIEPETHVIGSVDELRTFVNQLKTMVKLYGSIELGSDIETSGFNPRTDRVLLWALYPHVSPKRLQGGRNLLGRDNTGYIIPDTLLYDPDAKSILQEMSDDLGIILDWHNGKFDWGFLQEVGINVRVDEDSMLMSYALDESSGGHDLEELSKNLLGAPSYKGIIDKYIDKKTESYAAVPRDVLNKYAAIDVKNTAEIVAIQRDAIKADMHLNKLYYQTLLPASALLAEIERDGIYTDLRYAAENRVALEREQEAAVEELREIAGYSVNPNSPQQVSKFLYQELGLRIKGKIPQGTDKKILTKLPPHPAIKVIERYRSAVKALSTYVKAVEELRDDSGRIHTTFKLHVTTTGRLSSSRPNIQNIPRNATYKRMYCAPPGRVLLESDYNTAELRMLAALSEDEFLCGIFLDGTRNLHDEVAIKMYGADFTPDQRVRAKAVNFGIPYGREAFSIAEEFDISTKEAQQMIDDWFAAAPGAAEFIKACRAAPGKGQTLITAFGRKRRPGLVTEMRLHELQNEFANFFMQSTISDFTLHAAMRIQPQIKILGAFIVNLVHDSIITECPDDPEIIAQVAAIIKREMMSVPKRWIDTPIEFLADFKVGTHWGMLKHYEVA